MKKNLISFDDLKKEKNFQIIMIRLKLDAL